MSPCLWQDIWRVPFMNINTRLPPTSSMHRTNGKEKIMGPKISGREWYLQTYPPTWRQKIDKKGGRKNSLLCKCSWPHNSVIFRYISDGTVKSNRSHQGSGGPFNWLLWHKSRLQIIISFQINEIAHTQKCIISIRTPTLEVA